MYNMMYFCPDKIFVRPGWIFDAHLKLICFRRSKHTNTSILYNIYKSGDKPYYREKKQESFFSGADI